MLIREEVILPQGERFNSSKVEGMYKDPVGTQIGIFPDNTIHNFTSIFPCLAHRAAYTLI